MTDKTAIWCRFCKKWSYFKHHATEWCFKCIESEGKSSSGLGNVLLRANLASLAIDEDDMFTPVISLACTQVNTDVAFPTSTHAMPPYYRDFSLDVSINGDTNSSATLSNHYSFLVAPLGMPFDEIDGPYVNDYYQDSSMLSTSHDVKSDLEYNFLSVTNSIIDDLCIHSKSYKEVFLERRQRK